MSVENVMKLIRYVETRESAWDAVLKLKLLSFDGVFNASETVSIEQVDKKDPYSIGALATHHNWLIRWVIIEKLIDYDNPQFYPLLVKLLCDQRPEISEFHLARRSIPYGLPC